MGQNKRGLHARLAKSVSRRSQPISAERYRVNGSIAIAIGLLVGFEREWANKDIGVRTFALTSLLGLLASLIDVRFGVLAGGSILLLIVFLNLHSVQAAHTLEATTSVSLFVVFVLGVLVGDGHLFTPVACAIVVAMLLSLTAIPRVCRRPAPGGSPQRRSSGLAGLCDLAPVAGSLYRPLESD